MKYLLKYMSCFLVNGEQKSKTIETRFQVQKEQEVEQYVQDYLEKERFKFPMFSFRAVELLRIEDVSLCLDNM